MEGYKPTQKDESILTHPMSVASLINLESRSWNMERLEELFDTESVLAITKNVIPVIPQQDKIIWIKDTKGKFSVKSAFIANTEHLMGTSFKL